MKRADLQQKAHGVLTAALAKLRGIPLPLDPSELIALAQGEGVVLLDVLLAVPALRALELDDILDVIADARKTQPLSIPIVILVEDWATLEWTDCVPLASGGVS